MSAETKGSTNNESCSRAEELKRSLDSLSFQTILYGTAGIFSLRYWFINEYINYVNQRDSNASHKPSDKVLKKEINSKRFYKFIKKLVGRKENDQTDILFISRNRNVIVKTEHGPIEGDYIFYSIIDKLKKNYPQLSFKLFIIDESTIKYEYASLIDLLRSIYYAAEKSIMWSYRGRDAKEHLKGIGCGIAFACSSFFFHFRPLLRYMLMGYSMKNMLDSHTPSVIISNDDCFYTKPLGINNIKVIVLQSARMAEHFEECRSFIFQEPGLRPDYFLSSGKIFGEIKNRWHIAEKVVVTGLPRYDILYNANKIYSRSDFLQRYNINPEHKIVLWSTQCHVFSDEENAANFNEVFAAMKDLKDVTLVIKQHPAEEEKYAEEILRFIKRNRVDAVITPKDSDTYEQLFVCDLMITRHSTTAMEAVALNKPVIILNLSGKPDPVEYVEEGVAVGVYTEGELILAIKGLLNDDSDLVSNRDRYVEKYLYKIDGKATQRVLDIILKSLAEKESHETSEL